MGFGKDNKGVIIQESRSQAIGTLATSTGLVIGTNLGILERFRMLKAEMSAIITGATTLEMNGMRLYLVDGDLSLPEIEAQIEGNGPVGPNDRIAADIAERFVILAGTFLSDGGDVGVDGQVVCKDKDTNAPVIMVKPRWTFARTKGWDWVLYNATGRNVPTTGATVRIICKNFGVWVL